MFGRYFMIRANDRPLQKRPYALNRVSVDVTPYPFLGTMIDRFVLCISVSDSLVGRPFVSVDSLSIRGRVLSDKLVECLTSIIVNHLKPCLTATLSSTYHDCLVALVAVPHSFSLTAHVSLIDFHNALEQTRRAVIHRSSYPVAKIPGCLIGHPDSPLNLISGYAFLGFNHQIHGSKPLPQGKVAVMKYSASSYGELDRKSV